MAMTTAVVCHCPAAASSDVPWVAIDSLTEVPVDLFQRLLQEGRRSRGQHRVQPSPRRGRTLVMGASPRKQRSPSRLRRYCPNRGPGRNLTASKPSGNSSGITQSISARSPSGQKGVPVTGRSPSRQKGATLLPWTRWQPNQPRSMASPPPPPRCSPGACNGRRNSPNRGYVSEGPRFGMNPQHFARSVSPPLSVAPRSRNLKMAGQSQN